MTVYTITDPRNMPDHNEVKSGDVFVYGKMWLGFGIKGDSHIDSNPELIKALIRNIQITLINAVINEKQTEAIKQGKDPLEITEDNFDNH